MEDTALFTMLLEIRPPWRVTRVEVRIAAERIDVWVEEAPGTPFPCAVCATLAPAYDHTGRAGLTAPGYLPVPDVRARPAAPDDLPRGWREADPGPAKGGQVARCP